MTQVEHKVLTTIHSSIQEIPFTVEPGPTDRALEKVADLRRPNGGLLVRSEHIQLCLPLQVVVGEAGVRPLGQEEDRGRIGRMWITWASSLKET